MSVHIGAKAGEIAESILLPGDPLRARFIAQNFLEDVHCYNEVRGMLGYTGLYKGQKVSVQGTGMGIPSISIYVNELIREYGVKQFIRVGSCGSYQPEVKLNELILAMSASSNSSMNMQLFKGMSFAPSADFAMLQTAWKFSEQKEFKTHVGNILSSDIFYEEQEAWKLWAAYGTLAVEMETSALYTLAAKYKARALSILTVSDSLVTGEALSAMDRERSFTKMVEPALETILNS
jgi:purine-nucleoside phosphorylase